MTSERRVVAIVQARMGSERLPGKVLAEIAGAPMLARVVERARRIASVDDVAVATSDQAMDDPIAALGEAMGWPLVRGEAHDVLARFCQAASELEADVIVRLTGDCPLLDPSISEATIRLFQEARPPLDFAANRLPDHRTFPIGLDTEVCSRAALERACRDADQPHQREHVMPYLYDEPGRFRIALLDSERDLGKLRWTVDTPEDLAFVRAVYAAFAPRTDFHWGQVLELLDEQPALRQINANVQHRALNDVDPRTPASRGS